MKKVFKKLFKILVITAGVLIAIGLMNLVIGIIYLFTL